MVTFLTLASGIGWSIVYIELIRNGLKEKACGMPLFALCLNIAWEFIYGIDGIIDSMNSGSGMEAQQVVNIIWALLDFVILCIYFKYGKQYYPEKAQKYFVPFSILALIACTAIQLGFFFEFKNIDGRGPFWGAVYSAYAQNALMSILFVTQLFVSKKGIKGQSILMAVAKWIGTLAPAILHGLVMEFDIYVIIMGVICTVFDLIYITFLTKAREKIKA